MVKTLSFYDVKLKKKVNSTNYKIVSRMVKGNKRMFAVATIKGRELWRVLPAGFKK